MRLPLLFYKIFKYEYWPMLLFYIPVLPYWFYLAIKNKSLAYFSVANPGIDLGGFFGESKSEILALIDKKYLPKGISVNGETDFIDLKNQLLQQGIFYPIIAKPDVGERGNDVSKINSETELLYYHTNTNFNYIIQEFVDYEFEFGVLYSRLPNAKSGIVTSVTLKEFLTVIGDGKSTILQLIHKSTRARFQENRLKKQMGNGINRILNTNERYLLEPIGNHCRGTRFINFNHIINQNVHKTFDKISVPINGFYYGRYDLKVKSINDLQNGINIKIMELNGASSEPGHIYDTSFTLFRAYKDLLWHWKRLSSISAINIKKGLKPVAFSVIVKSYWKFVLSKK